MTFDKLFLDWIIKSIAKLILTIANEHTLSCLDIKLGPLIFMYMHKGFASKNSKMTIRNIFS